MSDESSHGGSDTEEKQPTTIADDIVVTKYKMASEITNRIYKLLKLVSFLSILNNTLVCACVCHCRRAQGSHGEVCRQSVGHVAVRAWRQPID